MNKTFYLAFSGLIMLAAGIFLFFSEQIGISNSKILIPLLLFVSGGSAMIFSTYTKLPNIAKQYHIVQGLGLITFAGIIITIPKTLQSFLMIVTYFVIMYGLFEIIFAFAVLNSKHQIKKGIFVSRLIAGAINLIGGFILLLTSLENEIIGLSIASILIGIGGVSVANFARNLRKMEF